MDLQRNTVKSNLLSNKPNIVSRNNNIQRVVIGLLLFFIIYGFIASSIAPKKYNLFEGVIAADEVISPKDVDNEYATQKLVDEAIQNVGKVYVIDNSIREDALKSLKDFFMKVSEIKTLQNVKDEVKIERLKLESTIVLANDDYKAAIEANSGDLKTLQQYIIDNLYRTLSSEISSDEKDLKSKQDDFSSQIKRNLKLSNEIRNLGIDIGFALIKPNMVFNSKETEERIKEAKEKVQKVRVKKGQIIVEKGKEVTKEQIEILRSLNLLEEQKKIDYPLYIGLAIIIALLEGLIILYMYRFAPEILKDKGKLILLSLIIIVELLFAKFASVYSVSGYLVPVAFATMIISILMKPRLALVLNIALSAFITLMLGYNIDIFIVAIISGSAGAIVISKMHQRNDLITAGLLISIINILCILGIGLITSAQTIPVLKRSVLGLINGALSSIFTLGLLPFCETMFDIVTPIKLLELSNPNQPLLKKLLFDAPGTYHHSVIVGNLAEAAVDAIGGNSLLARVGSYYHDVGKIKRPYFFKENQLTNENPHDKITPSLSTLIITNHIKDGIELAKKYKVPTVIKDIIEQHHGTTLVKYFYMKAINGSDDNNGVEEVQFRYGSPKPQNKETAVVMLADSVEAAVRSIQLASKPKIEEMVKKIIKDKLDDGQLDECDLTLKDIKKITESFLNILSGIYHDRIEYPDDVESVKGGSGNDVADR